MIETCKQDGKSDIILENVEENQWENQSHITREVQMESSSQIKFRRKYLGIDQVTIPAIQSVNYDESANKSNKSGDNWVKMENLMQHNVNNYDHQSQLKSINQAEVQDSSKIGISIKKNQKQSEEQPNNQNFMKQSFDINLKFKNNNNQYLQYSKNNIDGIKNNFISDNVHYRESILYNNSNNNEIYDTCQIMKINQQNNQNIIIQPQQKIVSQRQQTNLNEQIGHSFENGSLTDHVQHSFENSIQHKNFEEITMKKIQKPQKAQNQINKPLKAYVPYFQNNSEVKAEASLKKEKSVYKPIYVSTKKDINQLVRQSTEQPIQTISTIQLIKYQQQVEKCQQNLQIQKNKELITQCMEIKQLQKSRLIQEIETNKQKQSKENQIQIQQIYKPKQRQNQKSQQIQKLQKYRQQIQKDKQNNEETKQQLFERFKQINENSKNYKEQKSNAKQIKQNQITIIPNLQAQELNQVYKQKQQLILSPLKIENKSICRQQNSPQNHIDRNIKQKIFTIHNSMENKQNFRRNENYIYQQHKAEQFKECIIEKELNGSKNQNKEQQFPLKLGQKLSMKQSIDGPILKNNQQQIHELLQCKEDTIRNSIKQPLLRQSICSSKMGEDDFKFDLDF